MNHRTTVLRWAVFIWCLALLLASEFHKLRHGLLKKHKDNEAGAEISNIQRDRNRHRFNILSFISKNFKKNDIITQRCNVKLSSMLLRAGSADQSVKNNDETVAVIVSTAFGSAYLDKKKKFLLLSNATLLDLNEQIAKKFPGSPPAQLQRIFFSSRHLNNSSENIANISAMRPIPLILDTICGTGVYNRTMSISQALEAYVASVVQQSFIGSKIKALYQQQDSSNTSEKMESIAYRKMFLSLNESVYSTYEEEIKAALQEERNPDTLSPDTAAWRSKGHKKVSPLAAALAKEFDLNIRGLKSFLYYSVVLLVRRRRPLLYCFDKTMTYLD